MTVRAFANRPGEMARRIREMDWSATPLDNSHVWPQSLKLSIALILASGFPMAIRWGPELVLIYNDAYRPILRDKHPQALGRSLREVWWEVYPELGPLNEAILRGEREAFFAEDHSWAVRREGAIAEDARFTISYSPIPDEAAPHGIGGILTTCIETTERVRKEEALHLLNDRLEAEIAQRVRERDRIWQVSEDLLGVSNFEGYFTSVNPAWTALLAGARTRSRGCMSASCGTLTTRPIQWPAAGGSPKVFRPCAWRTVFATRTARGAGSPGH
jgi:PAS domain-containing protein